ncbi:uncharacterized protein RCO7_02315 [Rhynchosporium graminicola]|uniref:RING-type domain-containing protein n=1 Tax=Rhynchosporium graminicola TaxID=2792576 RepID=A0A1E1JVX9_9HELO|nr:uncharacterized protein RCO7_02315 [Rhynchosporium commune]
MCITQIVFKIACGHVIYQMEQCPESATGTCDHTIQRLHQPTLCNPCGINLGQVPHPDIQDANYIQFQNRSHLDTRRDIRQEFSAELADGHILASIPAARLTYQDAWVLTLEYEQVMERLQDRLDNDAEDIFVWNIENLDGVLDDRNRARVLGEALFRVPEHILGEFTHAQLQDHAQSLVEELARRRLDLREDNIRLQRVSRLLSESVPRDPTGRSREERLVEEQAALANEQSTRSRAISSILTTIDINTLEDNEQDQACAICTDPLGVAQEDHEAEEPCSLPCGHIIGRSCITQWLKSNSTCPLCRRDYNLELSLAPDLIQDPPVLSPTSPLREITSEARRDAQITQARSRRERGDRDPDHEEQDEDLDQPAGEPDFLAGLATAARSSAQELIRHQVEMRQAAQRELISPVRQAVTAQRHVIESSISRRRRHREWRVQELEYQLEEDSEALANNFTQQTTYQGHLDVFDQYIQSTLTTRSFLVDSMTANEDDVLILAAHDDILDDAYRVRELLLQAQSLAEQETRRLNLAIEQDYVDLDNAYIYDTDHEELRGNLGIAARRQARRRSSSLDDRPVPIPHNSPPVQTDTLDRLLRQLE